MKKWIVYLPNNKRAWLESDTPKTDLEALGIKEYALLQVCKLAGFKNENNPGYPVLK